MPARWRRSRSSAPEGCLLNAKRPRAVAARHTVGHMLPDVVFGCLHQVMEGGVPAEGASSLWIPQIYGGADVLDELGAEEGSAPPEVKPFSTVIFHCGGTGARPGKDGLDVTAFPSGVRTIPVEATESVAPVMFRRREFREGSGGAGQLPRRARPDHRTGRRRRHADRDAVQFRAHRQPGARPRRRRRRARRAGSPWSPASRSAPKGRQSVPGGDFIRLELPGGGGFGDPADARSRAGRARCRRRADLARDRARDYRVALAADGALDRTHRGTARGLMLDAERDILDDRGTRSRGSRPSSRCRRLRAPTLAAKLPRLPDDLHPVGGEGPVAGDDRDSLGERLGDHHPIEGVAVNPRQEAKTAQVHEVDREDRNPRVAAIVSRSAGNVSFPEDALNRKLPQGRRC